MKRKIAGSVLSVIAATAMFCPLSVAAEEETCTITYWVHDRHDSEYMADVIDRFNEENEDGIFVEMQVVTDNYEALIEEAYEKGKAPDIVGKVEPLRYFVQNEMLLSLNAYIDEDEVYQKVNEPYEHMYQGRNAFGEDIYWVYSGMRSGVRIQYNKDLLEENGYTEIPDTLEEYIEMAKTLTENGKGEYYGIGFTSNESFERLLEMVAQISGIYYYDYVNGEFNFDGYEEILELGKRFIEEEIAYPEQQNVDNMRALFAKGKFILWSNASQEAGVFTTQLPIEDFEWGVAELPSLTGEIKGALQMTPNKGYAIMSSSKHPDEAWKVIQYLQSEEVLKGYLEGGYCLPISEYMEEIVEVTGKLADFELLDYEDVYPMIPAVTLEGDDYRTVFWDVIMGELEADEAIEDLNLRYNEAYEADIKAGVVKRVVVEDYDPLHPSKGKVSYLEE